MKKFTLPEGFTIELFAAEPFLKNPVSFGFNEKGDAFVAETYRLNNSVFDITQNTNWLRDDLSFQTVEDRVEYMKQVFATNLSQLTANSERLQMIVDRDEDGRADEAKTVLENLNAIESGIAAGVLARGSNVWFTSIPNLWRLMDENGDGIPEKSQKLHEGFGVHIGVTGHDLHGLAMGPDGRIYFSIGDRGFNVPVGRERLEFPHTGGVFRCDPDGKNLELFAVGLRNPQELAFDAYGNLWTGDNDTAGPDDSRLIYVVEGGDYGWRCSYQHMKDFGPWVLEDLWKGRLDGTLPHSGLAAQGPSGLTFYPGTGMPAEYENTFFICDFPGGIYSFQVESSGASFQMVQKKKFLWNAWPTDVEFGPGGGIYFSDWVGGWGLPDKGRIYHVVPPEVNAEETEKTRALLAADFSSRAMAEVLSLLDFADLRVRQKAQFELVERGAGDELMSVIAGSGSQFAKIHAAWGIEQLHRRGMIKGKEAISGLGVLMASDDAELRAQGAQLRGEVKSDQDLTWLVKLLRDESPRVRFFAVQSLGQLGAKNYLPEVVELARRNNDEDAFITHAVVTAVSELANRSALKKIANDESAAVRRIALLSMRGTKNPAITQFLSDSDPGLVVEAARAINDVPINKGMSALARSLEQASFPEGAVSRALNANFRLGTRSSAARLGKFAVREEASDQLRAMAIEMLGEWGAPDSIDRVVGLWRPIGERNEAPARKVLAAKIDELLAAPEPVRKAAIAAVGALKLKEGAPALLALFSEPGTSAIDRAEVLRTLAVLEHPSLLVGLEQAFDSTDIQLNLLACEILQKTKVPSLAPRLAVLGRGKPQPAQGIELRLQKEALHALGYHRGPEAKTVFNDLLKELEGGTLRPELRLEVMIWGQEISHVSAANEAALTAGGDSLKGAQILKERADVSCIRCHAIKGSGGTVGPDLAGIGERKTREYLLQSITEPNRHIAEGYDQVVIRLRDGSSVGGTLKKETEAELEIDSPEDGLVRLEKSKVEQRTRSLSAMPEGLAGMLTPFELRDLVEYLATLK